MSLLGDRWEGAMSKLRYVSFISVFFSYLGSLLMFVVGSVKSIKAFRIYFFNEPLYNNPPPPPHLDFSEQAMIAVVEAMDAFLLALVLLIFAGGIYNLFLRPTGASKKGDDNDGGWRVTQVYNIQSFERLKQVLMEVILVVLAVLFLRGVLFMGEDLQWRVLILPVGIALIALSLKLMEWHRTN